MAHYADKRKDRRREEPHDERYNPSERERVWPSVRVVFEDSVGRIIRVDGERRAICDPYYVVHSWDNPEKTATSVEDYCQSFDDAKDYLASL